MEINILKTCLQNEKKISSHWALIKWRSNITCVGEYVPSADGGVVCDGYW